VLITSTVFVSHPKNSDADCNYVLPAMNDQLVPDSISFCSGEGAAMVVDGLYCSSCCTQLDSALGIYSRGSKSFGYTTIVKGSNSRSNAVRKIVAVRRLIARTTLVFVVDSSTMSTIQPQNPANTRYPTVVLYRAGTTKILYYELLFVSDQTGRPVFNADALKRLMDEFFD